MGFKLGSDLKIDLIGTIDYNYFANSNTKFNPSIIKSYSLCLHYLGADHGKRGYI